MQISDERILAIGAISLALCILIKRFLYFEYAVFSVTDVIEGFLIQLSSLIIIAYLIRKRNKCLF